MDASDFTRRDLAPAASAFLCGILALLTWPTIPDVHTSAMVGCAALASCLVMRRHWAQLIIWACGGFLLAEAHVCQQLRHAWPEHMADERVRVHAVVESIPEPRGEDCSFDATVRMEAPHAGRGTMRVRIVSRDAAVRPHAGEHWRLVIALRPPRATLNPGAIDHERLMFHEGINALGTVVSSRLNERLGTGERPLTALRERIAQHIEQHVNDRDASALIAALAVGATGAMSREQWRVFNATGTTHLVAISGLHVTLFAMVMFAVARRLWSTLLWRCMPCNRESFAAVFGLAAATTYAMLAGLSIPTQRTLIMLAAWLIARGLARNASTLQPLAIALLAVLILDPLAPLTAGFWLSFGAMSAIVLVTSTRFARRSTLHEAIAVQLAVTVLLVPFTLASFGSVSVVGPLVNAAAIPYMSWLLVPVVLLAVALLPVSSWASGELLSLAEHLHDFAWPWLAAVADSPMALAYASPPLWWYALAACGALLGFAPWPARVRLAVAICVVPLVAAGSSAPREHEIEITALDMGTGSATVLRTSRHTLVYGTGESYGTAGSRTERVIVPFLRSQGIRAVDRLVVRRLTPVTGEGVTALLAALPVGKTWVGGQAPADFEGAISCGTGESWEWDGVSLRILESCEVEAVAQGVLARLSDDAVRITDARGRGWAIVSGSSARNGKRRLAVTSAGGEAGRVLATGDLGAIRIGTSEGEITVLGQREERPAPWRAPADPAPTPK